jgi:hypothetical protein
MGRRRPRRESKREEKIDPLGDFKKGIDKIGSQNFYTSDKLKPDKIKKVIPLSSQSCSNDDEILPMTKSDASVAQEKHKETMMKEALLVGMVTETGLTLAPDPTDLHKQEQKMDEKSNLSKEKRKNFAETSIKLQPNKLSVVSIV